MKELEEEADEAVYNEVETEELKETNQKHLDKVKTI